jgi:Tfp pilus assembly protein PilV
LKKGFGLISALIIMLLVSALMVAVVKFAFINVTHTSDSYLQQRAQLFMQSAIENAVMAIEGYDRKKKGNCLRKINFTDGKKFDANITILRYYCYDGNCSCSSSDVSSGLVKPVNTPQSNGYVLMDVVVVNKNSNLKRIRLEKVTLQRP